MRYLYTFTHGLKEKTFGPYEDEDEAKSAFQRVYGYWPGPAVRVNLYD